MNKLSHKSCKELRNAGFPYIQKKVKFNKYEKVWKYVGGNDKEDPMATDPQLAPTLSELIDACRGDFFGLMGLENHDLTDGNWEAWAKFPCDVKKQTGKTPEEAVAKLWLVLKP